MKVKHQRVMVGDGVLVGDQAIHISGIDESDDVLLVDVIHQGRRRALWPKDSTRIGGVHFYARVEPPKQNIRGRIILTMIGPSTTEIRMLLTMPRTVKSVKNRAHVKRFEQLEQAFEVEDRQGSICRFGINGYTIRLTWDEGAGAALYVHCDTYGMVRHLPDCWDVDEVAYWLERISRIIDNMEGS